jgi:hypothetical protein
MERIAERYSAEKNYQSQVTKLALSHRCALLEALHKLKTLIGLAMIGSVRISSLSPDYISFI